MGTGIKIEVLYGEFANLFGELQNVNYLKSCIPDAEVIYTGLHAGFFMPESPQFCVSLLH